MTAILSDTAFMMQRDDLKKVRTIVPSDKEKELWETKINGLIRSAHLNDWYLMMLNGTCEKNKGVYPKRSKLTEE